MDKIVKHPSNAPSRDHFPVIDLFDRTGKPAPVLVLSVLRTAWLLDQVVAHALAPFKLHFAQFNALLLLQKQAPAGVRPSAIGEFLCVSRPNVTKLLARLHSRSLVEERPDPDDGRAIRAFITATGAACVDKAAEVLHRDLHALVGTIPGADAKTFLTLLDQFRDSISGSLMARSRR